MYKQIKGGTCETIQGLDCWIPVPPAVHEIEGYNLPKKEQKWRRTELPKEWEDWREEEAAQLLTDPDYIHDKIEAFVIQEWQKRLFGYWFMVNGKKRYITGKHYFYANWWKLDNGYPRYRDTDRRIFYFWQYCIEDPRCYGMVEMTCRRQGKSYRAACEMYEELSRPPAKSSGGIQSKTRDDAKELFDEKLVEPWRDLPDFFKPESDSGTDPKSVLSFRKQAKRGKDAKKAKLNQDEELRNFIDYKPAKETAYDGKAKRRILHDETGKTLKEEANVWERHKIVKPCCVREGEVWGKIYNSTTVEDLSRGGAEFEMIWRKSNIEERDGNGETESGLYKFFLSVLEGEFYDEYGYPDVEKSRKKHDNKREALKNNPNDLASYMRMFPYTEEEPFMMGTDTCEFNSLVLNKRWEELKLGEPVQRGDVDWTNGRDSDVRFIANPNGKCKVAFIPYEPKQLNMVERGPMYYKSDGTTIGTWRPKNDLKYRIGIDPVEVGKGASDTRVSKFALYVFQLFDITIDTDPNLVFNEETAKGWDYKIGKNKWKTYRPILQYIYREDDPKESYEYVIKIMRFFGCSVFPENNKGHSLMHHLEERGYKDFIKYRPKQTWTNNSGSQNTEGAASSDPVIQQYLMLVMSYVNNYGHLIPFIELVVDLLKFRRGNITRHDATVAFGFTLMATLGEAKQSLPPIELGTGLRKYSLQGTETTLIR